MCERMESFMELVLEYARGYSTILGMTWLLWRSSAPHRDILRHPTSIRIVAKRKFETHGMQSSGHLII